MMVVRVPDGAAQHFRRDFLQKVVSQLSFVFRSCVHLPKQIFRSCVYLSIPACHASGSESRTGHQGRDGGNGDGSREDGEGKRELGKVQSGIEVDWNKREGGARQ